MLRHAGTRPGARACDVGAGVAHLTLELLKRGLDVVAVEPNDEMRRVGSARTQGMPRLAWFEGTGEATGQATGAFALVTFGSSFNVCDRPKALREAHRILAPGGWFACMWNHRELTDPLQERIERAIQARVAGYSYGTRREDQSEVIAASGLFGPVRRLEGQVRHTQSKQDCLDAWRSHATLQRQAGPGFAQVIQDIGRVLEGVPGAEVVVPYTTRVWMAQRKA
jgi:SAM-dependent methyltransferase